jgi:hypothetical protein
MENKITVTYETFGGTYIAPKVVVKGTFIRDVIPKNTPKKEGKEFEGWYFTEDCKQGTRVIGYEPIENDITLYANMVYYYPFEVSNISHSYECPVLTVTWDNPSDADFSHVTEGDGTIKITNGKSTTLTTWGISQFFLKCVDIYGNKSRGINYIIDVDQL